MPATGRIPYLAGIALLAIAGVGGRADAAVPTSVLTAAERRLASSFATRGVAYPPRAVTLIVLKAEARLELWADGPGGWAFVRSYLVRSASGGLGPKLAEGDHQVPEGVYRIDALNPDSSYHLSMHIDYPNAFDRMHASEDGRTRLGGAIMIHGGRLSDGCLPVGDPAVEELFALTTRVGTANMAVIISPVDLRRVQVGIAAAKVAERPRWLGTLYGAIATALKDFVLPEDDVPDVVAGRTAVVRPRCSAYDEADCVRRCQGGDADSCARAGLMYRQGRGVAADVAKAWTFLRKACAGGDALGCAELSQLYVVDDGPRRDASRAAELAKAACDAGDGHGCSDLVDLCAERIIYPGTRDECGPETLQHLNERAVAALRQECSGWGAYDCATLATIYAAAEPATALRFASGSCQGGDPGGCDDLGRLYESAGDTARAREVYRRACDTGYARACERLGAGPTG